MTSVQSLLEEYDEELDLANNKVAELESQVVTLKQRMANLQATKGNGGMLQSGQEQELYPGEFREILLEILSEAIKTLPDGRRRDVVNDILSYNPAQKIPQKREQILKNALKGYSVLDSSLKKKLQEAGIAVVNQKRGHYKLVYENDARYFSFLPCTGSDKNRGGKNLACELVQKFL